MRLKSAGRFGGGVNDDVNALQRVRRKSMPEIRDHPFVRTVRKGSTTNAANALQRPPDF